MRLGFGLVLIGALGLAGCIHPLYGNAGGADVAAEMQAIAVDPIPDRLGHYLANDLTFALHGGQEEVPPKYHLIITTSESTQSGVVDTRQGRATAGTLVTNVTYRLVPSNSATVLTSGTISNFHTYDRSEQRYANIRAARDAEIRNSSALADELKTKLALYFTSRS